MKMLKILLLFFSVKEKNNWVNDKEKEKVS